MRKIKRANLSLLICIPLLILSGQKIVTGTPVIANNLADYSIPQPEVPPLKDASVYLPDVPSPPLRVVIKLSERQVYVYEGDEVTQRYPIAIGRQGWETPSGDFEVIQMVRNPIWVNPFNGTRVPPGPNNPLGQYWIGFWKEGEKYIGMHGTPDESVMGQAVSHGCVRMKNADVLALFQKVQVGTPVTVEP